MLIHIVFFKAKDRSKEHACKVQELLLSLAGKVPQIRQIEAGVNIVEFARAYDMALIIRFDSLSDMEQYQKHPEHVAIVEQIRPLLEGTASVDYTVP